MTIIFPTAPAGSEDIIRPALEMALNAQAFGIRRELTVNADTRFSLSPAWQGYFLPLNELAHGAGLEKAVAGNWHRLVFINDEGVMEAQLAQRDNVLTFSSLNVGPVAPAMVEALNQAEDSALLDDGDYEVRMLSVPALHLVALWLCGAEKEVFIPIAPTPASLLREQITDWAELSGVLVPAAQALKKSADADRSGIKGG